MHLYREFLLLFLSITIGIITSFATPARVNAQENQRLVESVDVTGNRRLRKDDILYYIQTRPGDPYNEDQVNRDYQTLLSLPFFDKTRTRVLKENGARGGINIIFEVHETTRILTRGNQIAASRLSTSLICKTQYHSSSRTHSRRDQ